MDYTTIKKEYPNLTKYIYLLLLLFNYLKHCTTLLSYGFFFLLCWIFSNPFILKTLSSVCDSAFNLIKSILWINLMVVKSQVSTGTRTQGLWRTVSALYPLSYWDPMFWLTFTHRDTWWHKEMQMIIGKLILQLNQGPIS